MTTLESSLREIVRHLTEAQIGFALVGGLGVSVRTEPRFTRDTDLVVAAGTDAEAEALVHRLRALGFGLHSVVEQEAVGRLAAARLLPQGDPGGPVVDLLFASSGLEREIVEDAEVLEVLPGLALPVARTGHLVALKVLARDDERRPQDLGDLRALLRVASADEIARARRALAVVVARGFHRGRDVLAMLEALVSAGAKPA